MMLGLFDAMMAWAKKYQANKKFDMIWATAGVPGGGAVANVNSLEELNQIMAEFPMGPASEIKIKPIMDIQPALEAGKKAFLAMMPPK